MERKNEQSGGGEKGRWLWFVGGLVVVGLAAAAGMFTFRGGASVTVERTVDGGESGESAPSDDGDGGGAVSPREFESVDAVDLSGRWAHRSVQVSKNEVPIAGEVEAKTTSIRVTEIEQDGAGVTLESKLCDTRIESPYDRVRTEIPDAFIESAPEDERRGRLEMVGGHVDLVVGESCDVRGAEVEDPAESELPTDPDDERVVDEDNDGNPGVTIRIVGLVEAKLFLVQRGCDSYRGEVVSEDRIRGRIDWRTEQELLGSTSRLIRSRPDARPHDDPSKHRFEMRRIDDVVGCAQLTEKK